MSSRIRIDAGLFRSSEHMLSNAFHVLQNIICAGNGHGAAPSLVTFALIQTNVIPSFHAARTLMASQIRFSRKICGPRHKGAVWVSGDSSQLPSIKISATCMTPKPRPRTRARRLEPSASAEWAAGPRGCLHQAHVGPIRVKETRSPVKVQPRSKSCYDPTGTHPDLQNVILVACTRIFKASPSRTWICNQ